MAEHKHLEAWPGVLPPLSRTPSPAGLSGAAAKDGKGNPNPGRKHRAATLLSYSRDPRWHGGSEERCLLPSEWRSCQQAGPRLQQPGRVHCSRGEAVSRLKDVSSNKSLRLAGGEAPKANKPLAQGAPAGRRTVNQCITEVQGAWFLCQGWSTALALAETGSAPGSRAARASPARHVWLCRLPGADSSVPWENGSEARGGRAVVWVQHRRGTWRAARCLQPCW